MQQQDKGKNMYALVKNEQVYRLIDGTSPIEWDGAYLSGIRSMDRQERTAHKIYDFIPATLLPTPIGYKLGGTTSSISHIDGTVTETHNFIAMGQEEIDLVAAQNAAKLRDVAKINRAISVESIVVTTTAGNAFDGDEVSQNRMARAIIALQATSTPSISWVLANNTAIQASAVELTEALALAGAAQANVWVI